MQYLPYVAAAVTFIIGYVLGSSSGQKSILRRMELNRQREQQQAMYQEQMNSIMRGFNNG